MGLEVLIATAVIGTAASIYQTRKARKAQQRAARVQQRRREIESRRAKLANVEEARLAIGQIQNIAAQTGGQGGSGAAGNVASLVTQLGSNMNNICKSRLMLSIEHRLTKP